MHPITCTLILASVLVLVVGEVQPVFEWKFIDYVWPSEAVRIKAIRTRQYDFGSVIPMDVDVDKAGRTFLTFLGTSGVPATLGIVSKTSGPSGPLIIPYPNWNWFKAGDCNSLQNVYRIAIDECNRLWVLDTGFKEGEVMKCQSQLVIFDLNTDTWIQTIKIPNNITTGKNGATLLANPIVETEGLRCERTTVYIADVFGNALIVLNNEVIYRLEDPEFGQNPRASHFNTGNDTAEFHGGLLGLAVSPRLFRGEPKFLYFRPLASYDLFAINTDVFQRRVYGGTLNYQQKANIFSSQPVVMAFSSQGTLFYGLTREIAIGCWNRYRPLASENLGIVAQDSQRLQYLNGMKVIKASPAHPIEELWVLSNRFLGYLAGTLKINEVNYRVLKGSVQNLVRNTVCDLPVQTKLALRGYA